MREDPDGKSVTPLMPLFENKMVKHTKHLTLMLTLRLRV